MNIFNAVEEPVSFSTTRYSSFQMRTTLKHYSHCMKPKTLRQDCENHQSDRFSIYRCIGEG